MDLIDVRCCVEKFSLALTMAVVQDEEEEIRVEVNILKRFGAHENLTTFYGAFLVPVGWRESGVLSLWLTAHVQADADSADRQPMDKLWLVMELCEGGSVTDLATTLAPKLVPENVSCRSWTQSLHAAVLTGGGVDIGLLPARDGDGLALSAQEPCDTS